MVSLKILAYCFHKNETQKTLQDPTRRSCTPMVNISPISRISFLKNLSFKALPCDREQTTPIQNRE